MVIPLVLVLYFTCCICFRLLEEMTILVHMLLISENLQKTKWRKIRIQQHLRKLNSFWPLIVRKNSVSEDWSSLECSYLWTTITFGPAKDEFSPCGAGQARHQMSLHMLGCAWVTRSKGKKCVILESEAGTLEKKHDVTQLLPRFSSQHPKNLLVVPSFSPLAGTFTGPGGLAGRKPAPAPGDSCCSTDGGCLSRNWLPPSPLWLGAGKHKADKPEQHVFQSLLLGADTILNKHKRQPLNASLQLFFFFSRLRRSKSILAVLTGRREHRRVFSEGNVYFNFTRACLPEITWPRAAHTQSDDILISVWLRFEASVGPGDAEPGSYLRCTRGKSLLVLGGCSEDLG